MGGEAHGPHGDPHVAGHDGNVPEGVRTSSDDPDTGYLYRAGQILLHEDDLSLVWKELSLQRAEEVESDIDPRLRIRMFQAQDEAVPEIVRRATSTVAARISANVVLPLGWHISCPKAPEPVPPERVSILKSELLDLGPSVRGENRIRVGLIDTGAADHPWLSGRVEKLDPSRDNDVIKKDGKGVASHGGGHGTFTASQIVRNAPDATVVVRRAVEDDGTIDDVELANALLELRDLHGNDTIGVISLSMNGYTPGDTGLLATGEALRLLFAANPDLQVVVAAGNHASRRVSWPAAYKNVISVGAVTPQGERAYYSNYGYWVDACAVGTEVEGAFPMEKDVLWPHTSGPRDYTGGFAVWSGTSFTAPMVAGAIAAEMARGSTGPQAVDKLIRQRASDHTVPGLGVRIP